MSAVSFIQDRQSAPCGMLSVHAFVLASLGSFRGASFSRALTFGTGETQIVVFVYKYGFDDRRCSGSGRSGVHIELRVSITTPRILDTDMPHH